ncbi:MAG TPA: cytochrome c peroxidase [Beijerinckiaceae bacterium]
MPSRGLQRALLAAAVAVAPPAFAQGAPDAGLAALKELYRRPPVRPAGNPALVDLGKALFWDPRVSASGKTSCGSCHLPDLAWATREAKSRNDSGKLTSRKSQPVIGLGHAASPLNGWDGRNPTLEAQAKASVATGSMSMRETETPVKVEVVEARIRAVPEYVQKFEAALPGKAITLDTIAEAIAAYERVIEPGQAAFDRWIEGDEGAIPEAAKRGFALFNGKAACVACHGGWRFTDDAFHDIGSTATDLGRGREVKDDPLMQFAFKTPTLRSVATRPPYLHDGSAATLLDVIRLYERGGIDRPSRSPSIFPLDLSDQDRTDLVAFLETLTGEKDGGSARPQAGN